MLSFVSVRSLVVGAVFAAAAAFASVGSAATVKDLGGGVTCTYGATGAGVSASTDCAKASPLGPGGNTRLFEMNAQDIFTTKTWTLADKINLPDMVGEFLKITFSADLKSGTWSLLDGLRFAAGEFYAIALKGANRSFVYLLDTSATSGSWSMMDIRTKGGTIPALSNITLFGTADPAPIPLPATGLLLLAALGGLGLMRRRTALA
jgi:hypothetical protein